VKKIFEKAIGFGDMTARTQGISAPIPECARLSY